MIVQYVRIGMFRKNEDVSFSHFDSIDLGLSCNSNVCLNGGTCDYNSMNLRCICPVNFAGPRCEWSK
jgi:hypothetical protein